MSMYPTNLAKPLQIRRAFGIYRVLAIIAGIALFILIAEMILKYAMGQDNWLTRNWSYIHGFIYMGYAAAIANLGTKIAWPLKRIALHLLSGFVPVAPFIAERRVATEVDGLLARVY